MLVYVTGEKGKAMFVTKQVILLKLLLSWTWPIIQLHMILGKVLLWPTASYFKLNGVGICIVISYAGVFTHLSRYKDNLFTFHTAP